jgi:hypothetical protein
VVDLGGGTFDGSLFIDNGIDVSKIDTTRLKTFTALEQTITTTMSRLLRRPTRTIMVHGLFTFPSCSRISRPRLLVPGLRQSMADPSGAPPQPGPNDISTAILRPKKS